MSKFILSSTAITVGFSMALAVFGFLSKTMFEDARAVAADFREHQGQAQRIVAELKGVDLLQEQRVNLLEKKMDEANRKLDILLTKMVR